MIFPGIGLWLLFSIACCVHVVRTNQSMYWLWLVLIIPWLGALAYCVIVIIPSLGQGRTARRLGATARETLDPTREYRQARQACEASGTVHNRMRLAKAAAALGRHDEAEYLFGQAAQGIHAEDPALLLGRAQALVELGRCREALDLLDRLGEEGERARTPAAALALGRAYEGLGRIGEADTAYEWAAGRMPGLEAVGHYAAFLARHGRMDEARGMLAEMDRRISGANPQFRREGRHWRDLAAKAVAGS
ncbi:MAG: tetratricopeptide repeat protein [Caulobacteraceae bacterium]